MNGYTLLKLPVLLILISCAGVPRAQPNVVETALPEIPVVETTPRLEEPAVDLPEPQPELPETEITAIPPEPETVPIVLPEPAAPVLPPPEPVLPPAPVLATPEPAPSPQPVLVLPEPVPPPQPVPATPESAPPEPAPPPQPVLVLPEPVPPAAPAPAAPSPEPVPPPETRPAAPVQPQPPAYLGPAQEPPPAIVQKPVPVPSPVTTPPPQTPDSTADEAIVFSRIVRANAGQLVEIPFRGTGWVFLGELGAQQGVVFDSRRQDSEGQSFVFRTGTPGTYALKFYKQDFVRDIILNDYVQVIVGEPAENAGAGWFGPAIDRGRVIAEPRWPASLAEAQALRRGSRPESAANPPASPVPVSPGVPETPGDPVAPSAPAAQTSAGQTTPVPAAPSGPMFSAGNDGAVSLPPTVPESAVTPGAPAATAAAADESPESLLQKARGEFDAGRVAQAITLLDRFRERYPAGNDELWWLYGQFYEANSPSRDILTALDCYRRILNNPQGSRYNDARRRIAYLERYYINIQ